MDEIQDIVNSIVKGCSHGGMQVSDVLAAFIAKTVIYLSTIDFLVLDSFFSPLISPNYLAIYWLADHLFYLTKTDTTN